MLSRKTTVTLRRIARINNTSKSLPDGVSASKIISYVLVRHCLVAPAGF